MQPCVKVLIDGSSSDLSFSYLIPAGVEVAPGSRVLVPLGRREAIGTVMAVEEVDTSAVPYRMKPISKVVGSQPFLTEALLKLADWMAAYYMSSIEAVYRTMLPKPARGREEKNKKAKQVRLTAGTLANPASRDEVPKTAKKQVEAFDTLWASGKDGILLSEMTGAKGFGRSTISGLESKGLAEVIDVIVSRDPTADQ